MPNPLIQDPGRIRTLSAAMAKGEIMAEMLVQRYLDRIAAFDGQVRAWVHLLADAALAEARALDAERKASIIRDPLLGIPVGIKEVIDVRRTTDMQTHTVYDPVPFFAQEIVHRGVARQGLTWQYCDPSPKDLEFRIDCISIEREIVVTQPG